MGCGATANVASDGRSHALTRGAVQLPQKNLPREFKRILRPGGLLLIGDYSPQTVARNL
jgi:hypothetical protein